MAVTPITGLVNAAALTNGEDANAPDVVAELAQLIAKGNETIALVNQGEININALGAAVANNNANISSNDADITTLQGRATALEGRCDVLETTTGGLEGRIEVNELAIGVLQQGGSSVVPPGTITFSDWASYWVNFNVLVFHPFATASSLTLDDPSGVFSPGKTWTIINGNDLASVLVTVPSGESVDELHFRDYKLGVGDRLIITVTDMGEVDASVLKWACHLIRNTSAWYDLDVGAYTADAMMVYKNFARYNGSRVVTLPELSRGMDGVEYTIAHSGTGSVTVNAYAGDDISGAANITVENGVAILRAIVPIGTSVNTTWRAV